MGIQPAVSGLWTGLQQGLLGGNNPFETRGAGGVNQAGVPGANTSLIGDAITRALSGDLSNPLNSSINQAIQQQRSDDIDEMRARYNLAGLSYSSPAATGEAEYLARSSPALLNALGGQQLQMLGMLLPQYMNLTQMGTPQAQVIQEPGLAQNIIGGLTGLAGGIAPLFSPFGIFNKNPLGQGAASPSVDMYNPNYGITSQGVGSMYYPQSYMPQAYYPAPWR